VRRLTLEPTPLAGVLRVQRTRLGDARGYLERLFCADELREAGWTGPIAQINRTFTAQRGTVRGLHWQQPPHAEVKLVQCLRGEVYDVAVDLRAGSPTFLSWHAERLSPDNGHALLIPKGCAHGFQTLTDDVEMLYCHSAAYAAEAERGAHPQDAALAVDWPLPIAALSARDAAHPALGPAFEGIAP
jgi:dTDP-4-dehydrorhamnose 3,5-epimerase